MSRRMMENPSTRRGGKGPIQAPRRGKHHGGAGLSSRTSPLDGTKLAVAWLIIGS